MLVLGHGLAHFGKLCAGGAWANVVGWIGSSLWVGPLDLERRCRRISCLRWHEAAWAGRFARPTGKARSDTTANTIDRHVCGPRRIDSEGSNAHCAGTLL